MEKIVHTVYHPNPTARYDIHIEEKGSHVELILKRNGGYSRICDADVSYSRIGIYSSLFRIFHSFEATLQHDLKRMIKSIGRHHAAWAKAQNAIEKVSEVR